MKTLFRSYLMGGFECSTHRLPNGKRLDLIASTHHDKFAEADYERLLEMGMKTARDGVRWHLIEKEPYKYDFSSLKQQIEAVNKTGMQIIWDFFHYGFPDDLDIYSQEFINSTVGAHYAHPGKLKFKDYNNPTEQEILWEENARYAAQSKRNVSFPATMQEF